MDHLTTTSIEVNYLKAGKMLPEVTLKQDDSNTYRIYEKLDPKEEHYPSTHTVMRNVETTGFLWFKKSSFESDESLLIRAKQMYIDYVNRKLKLKENNA